MEKVTLKKRASEKMEAWKKEVNHLKEQLGQNAEEAKESFELQKKAVVRWTEEMKEEVEKLEEVGAEKFKNLKANLEDLRVQAALGRMETADTWQEQQKKINHSMHNLKTTVMQREKGAEENVKALLGKAAEKVDDFQTRFEMYRLQLADDKEGVMQNLQERKEDIQLRLEKMSAKLEESKEEMEEKWEHFREEMGEAWVHLKKAIKG